MSDPFSKFKLGQKEGWGLFAPLEAITTPAAATLVRFAELKPGQRVLDCACGTGVVAITAARQKAQVSALDLSPALLAKATENANLAQTRIDFTEGDVESLPYENDTFDLVLSQFGHMFAPRPEVAISEMLRVLKPGGRIAFSTWPPDHFVAKLFKITAKFASPVPDMPSPTEWGDPNYVQLRLENKVRDLMFDRSYLSVPVLSPQQARELFEKTAAPLIKLVNDLKNDPETLSRFRAELEALIISYTRDNILPQHYLMSRATKI